MEHAQMCHSISMVTIHVVADPLGQARYDILPHDQRLSRSVPSNVRETSTKCKRSVRNCYYRHN